MLQGKNSDTTHALSSSIGFSESGLIKAAFARRLCATLVDHLLVWTMVLVIGNMVDPEVYGLSADGSTSIGVLYSSILVALLLYYWLFAAWKGQTPGKRLLKIKVVNARGLPPGWGRVLWRESVGRIAMLVSLLVDAVALLFSNLTAYRFDNGSLNTYPEQGFRKAGDRNPVDILGFFDRFIGTFVVSTARKRRAQHRSA